MSEELFVEKPLLDQLQAMKWNVIVHAKGIPQNPSINFSHKPNKEKSY